MVLRRNPVNVAVALAVGLGLRTAGMTATQLLITHGSRACRLAEVGCGEANVRDVHALFDKYVMDPYSLLS